MQRILIVVVLIIFKYICLFKQALTHNVAYNLQEMPLFSNTVK